MDAEIPPEIATFDEKAPSILDTAFLKKNSSSSGTLFELFLK